MSVFLGGNRRSIEQEYLSSSSNDSQDTARLSSRSRAFQTSGLAGSRLLVPSANSSRASSANNTPLPSRSVSPLPQFFSSQSSRSSSSDTDSEPSSPLLGRLNNRPARRDDVDRRWWSIGSPTIARRKRRRDGKLVRNAKKYIRAIVRHPLFPRQPITILLTLLLLSVFAICLTLLLIHILNPDKEALPWRAYCSAGATTSPPGLDVPTPEWAPFPPPDLDDIPPIGALVGVFSMDSAFERRMLVRTTWASHARSREGAGQGDGGAATSRMLVRFILGQPRKDWERRVRLEMDMYNDIIILPMPENMNSGKTHTYFSWAALHAWVPPVYMNTTLPVPSYSYSNDTSPAPYGLAQHDSSFAWQDRNRHWVRPDYIVKVDDDSFVMLAELEARLRVQLHAQTQTPSQRESQTASSSMSIPTQAMPSTHAANESRLYAVDGQIDRNDPMVYWGYLVKNKFMAGELYALSWNLVTWVAKDPVVKTLTRGAEDKQTAKWMGVHPRARDIRWASEHCWIYDHPRAATVYSHGFLFPSEAARVRRTIIPYLEKTPQQALAMPTPGVRVPTPASWAYSTVSTFGTRYSPPAADLTTAQSIEALVEGSDMSMLREGSPMTPDYAWAHREGRAKRYEGKRVGGTIVVHFIKQNMWFLEAAQAMLEGDEVSEAEAYQHREMRRVAGALEIRTPIQVSRPQAHWRLRS